MIEIVPPKETWPLDFIQIGAAIRNALGDLAVRIDHIGSTSVPELPSKDIIDVQLTVQSFDSFEHIQAGLEAAGYVFQEGVTSYNWEY